MWAVQGFEFDRVFGPDSTQEQVFGDVAQLVTSVLDGYNVCIFAYGQTGAAPKHLRFPPLQAPSLDGDTACPIAQLCESSPERLMLQDLFQRPASAETHMISVILTGLGACQQLAMPGCISNRSGRNRVQGPARHTQWRGLRSTRASITAPCGSCSGASRASAPTTRRMPSARPLSSCTMSRYALPAAAACAADHAVNCQTFHGWQAWFPRDHALLWPSLLRWPAVLQGCNCC